MSCANALGTITLVMVQGLGITDTAELLLGGKAMSEAPFQKIYTKNETQNLTRGLKFCRSQQHSFGAPRAQR